MPTRVEKCSLCGHDSHIITESAPGYRKDQTFAIYECGGCFSSFASPLVVEDSIYEHVYNNVQSVPGYNRYYQYAYEVLKQKRPLDYLSRQEESYWAVARHLREKRITDNRLNVLEIGSGMGYFTYALVKDGIAAAGVDISQQAVAWALQHYGPYYACKTLQEIRAQGYRYNVIVMNQLIEHLIDVNTFMSDALTLLSPQGEIIITTPNKSAYPDVDWESDLPPVHLWWFGEDAMRCLAQRHGCTVAFINFELFYRSFARVKIPSTPLHSRQSILNADGTLSVSQCLPAIGPLRRTLEKMGALALLHKIRSIRGNHDKWRGAQGQIIAAVLRRTR